MPRRHSPRLTPPQKEGKEATLAAAVVQWLEASGWDVYQEVLLRLPGMPADRVADIIAVKDGQVWGVECKVSLTLPLLFQAAALPTSRASIAIPRNMIRDTMRAFGIQGAQLLARAGVLEVSGATGMVREAAAPPPRPEAQDAAVLALLRPEHKTHAAAGTSGGGFWTPYKETMDRVRALLAARGPLTVPEIVAVLGKGHYKTEASARGSLGRAFARWESGSISPAGAGRWALVPVLTPRR